MASIVWQIEYMKTTPTTANPPECVVTVGWRVNGTQVQDGKTYSATAYGTCSFADPGDPFTPYANLTENQVLGWVWANGVDKDAYEASMQSQIDQQINPPYITPKLPWLS
jgi:hypothetical protein